MKTEIKIIVTYAQKKDIERVLEKYCKRFKIDKGRALQLIMAEADNVPLESYE